MTTVHVGALKGHWLAALHRSARTPKVLGLWESLAKERRSESEVWMVLALASAALVAISFVWPLLHT
jgi:hypothetical protein